MKIITVTGEENVGKTELIWTVFDKLMKSGGELTYFHIVGEDANDFHAVLVWESKIIAVCSIGDKADKEKPVEQYIKDGIEMARRYCAEILINALSDTIDETYEKTKKQYQSLLNLIFTNEQLPKEFRLDRQNKIERQIKQKQENCKRIIEELKK